MQLNQILPKLIAAKNCRILSVRSVDTVTSLAYKYPVHRNPSIMSLSAFAQQTMYRSLLTLCATTLGVYVVGGACSIRCSQQWRSYSLRNIGGPIPAARL